MLDLVRYLRTLKVTQGGRAGKPFDVLPWQRKFLRGAFAPGVSDAALAVARGNGKSTLLAGVALAHLNGPYQQPRGEVVAVASAFSQARIIFEHALEFLRPELQRQPSRWRVQDSANLASIEDRQSGARLRCIGSDPRRAHGLAPVLVLADEPAQWPRALRDSMRAALTTARGKIPGSRFVALGTRPADADHWFAKMISPGGAGYCQSHSPDPADPPFRRSTWRKANPSLAAMPDLLETIKGEAKLARADGSLVPGFRALRLNLGVPDTESSVLLDAATWQSVEADELPPRAGNFAMGVDLGDGAAMSGCAAYWPATGRLEALAAFPERPGLAERGLADGVGRLYTDMAARGELLVTSGRAVSVAALLREAVARWGRPAVVAADRYRESDLRQALDQADFPSAVFVSRGQGFRDGSEDVRAFRRAVLEGRVVAGRSLLLRAALSEARVVCDASGNEKLAKSTQGGRRLRAKDDAAAAAILAVAEGSRRGERPSRSQHRFFVA